jgi:type IV pilus biogenesis protein CpaD/CtpE
MQNFNEIEALFTELLAQRESALSAAERDEIQEFFDVGEYGLALRTAVAIFREEKKLATATERQIFIRLAKAMSIDSDSMLTGLG